MKFVVEGGLCKFRNSTSPDYILIYGKTAAVLSHINSGSFPPPQKKYLLLDGSSLPSDETVAPGRTRLIKT